MKKNEELSNQRNRVLFKARFLMPSLGNAEKSAAQYLLQHPEEVSTSKISEYASACDVSDATIVRLSKHLGYEGFTELKNKLTREIGNTDHVFPVHPEFQEEKGFLSLANQIVQTSVQALNDTLTMLEESSGSEAIETISQARRILIYGLGDSGDVARAARHKFLRLGYDSSAPSDSDVQLMTARGLGEDDVALAITHSGESKPIVNATRIAHDQGATTICITNSPESSITKISDIKLFTAAGIAPAAENEVIARRIAELCIIDTLFVGIINTNKEEFTKKLHETAKELIQNKI